MVFEALCPNYDFSDETIQKIVGIFETNAIEIRMAMMSDVMALYETACLLEHNCVPNLHITFDKKFNVSLRICRKPMVKPYKLLLNFMNLVRTIFIYFYLDYSTCWKRYKEG